VPVRGQPGKRRDARCGNLTAGGGQRLRAGRLPRPGGGCPGCQGA
jgi:hypothetical protein